ncbi:retropepsin-like aspartic protease family protein [Endozoicomonas ascidiicola]|uniref:retropepsin-like aspartic protease family protein n=1 Tax=Endozoicomonas ascidiicola TaxID=1698521 RepID=UPI000A48440E|nr:TIGR02281 family clan AA aspartic protease [Endozoicomonas ascidiicola]
MRLLLLLLSIMVTTHTFASDVSVVALFSNKAMVMIDERKHVLSVGGRAVSGVKLVDANSASATLEINGQVQTLELSRDMSGGIQQPETASVSISRNNIGQYITQARINNHGMDVLVDTGANSVAINSMDAERLGIDYKSGDRITVETASSRTNGYRVILNSITIGNIRVPHVDATVIEGNFPDTVLLGMSFLKHVKLTEHRGIMKIESNY